MFKVMKRDKRVSFNKLNQIYLKKKGFTIEGLIFIIDKYGCNMLYQESE